MDELLHLRSFLWNQSLPFHRFRCHHYYSPKRQLTSPSNRPSDQLPNQRPNQRPNQLRSPQPPDQQQNQRWIHPFNQRTSRHDLPHLQSSPQKGNAASKFHRIFSMSSLLQTNYNCNCTSTFWFLSAQPQAAPTELPTEQPTNRPSRGSVSPSSSPSSSSESASEAKSNALHGGAIAGIIIAILVALLALLLVICRTIMIRLFLTLMKFHITIDILFTSS